MKYVILLLSLLFVVSCTTQGVNSAFNKGADYRPIIDTKNINMIAYEKDLLECKRFALQIDSSSEMLAQALGGAVAGAMVGGAIGSNYGRSSYGAEYGAKLGATSGTVRGYAQSVQAQEQIIRNCIIGRGYRLLF